MAAKVLELLLRLFQWIPVIFINTVIVWSYYAYVFILCIENVSSYAEKAIYLILYHPLFLLLMISYWRTIMADAGRIPSQFYLSRSVKEQLDNVDNPEELLKGLSRKLPVVTQTISGGVRVCDVCQLIKPDRCHHCSMCRKCILKMDHHCPWVNNCVGFTNYKFFLLFLFHAIVYTAYITATVTKYFIAFWNNDLPGEGKLHVLFLFFVALMFSISLWSLLGYHIFLTWNNRSTLESFRVPHFQHGPDKEGFSLGSGIRNAKQILGDNKWLWCLPVYTSVGDGIRFPQHNLPEEDHLLSNRQRWAEEADTEATEETSSSPAQLTHENEVDQPHVTVSHPHAVRTDILAVEPDNIGDEDDGTTL